MQNWVELNTPIPATPVVTSADRLGLTIFLAASLHAILILGVVFTPSPPMPDAAPPTLEVILAHNPAAKAPKQADFLAATHQQGSGSHDKAQRPKAPLPMVATAPPTLTPLPTALTPIQTQINETQTSFITTKAPQATPTPAAGEDELAPPPMPTAAEIIQRSREIARLSAEISDSIAAEARRPKHRWVYAATRAHRDASYLKAWQDKVEQTGNLNYPEEARRRHLTGSLILDVAIRGDGRVQSIEVLKSSGEKLLDDAAIRIVRLSAPFGRLPSEIRADTDILHIVRTWQFMEEKMLTTAEP